MTLRERLAQQRPCFGIQQFFPSHELIEIAGALGFDWVWIDVEHGTFDRSTTLEAVRAAEAVGVATVARVARVMDEHAPLPYLETGISGISAARVTSAADAERLVRLQQLHRLVAEVGERIRHSLEPVQRRARPPAADDHLGRPPRAAFLVVAP